MEDEEFNINYIISEEAWDLLDEFENESANKYALFRSDRDYYIQARNNVYEYIAKLEKIAGIKSAKEIQNG